MSSVTKMKTALIVASAAGLAAAQFSFNETTGKYTCAQPNQAYCLASGSMETNYILRCNPDAIGQPGNCNDVSFNITYLPLVASPTKLINGTEPRWGTSDGKHLLSLLGDLQHYRQRGL